MHLHGNVKVVFERYAEADKKAGQRKGTVMSCSVT